MKKLILILAIVAMAGVAGWTTWAWAGTAKIDWNESECAKEWRTYYDRIEVRGTFLIHIPMPDCPHPIAKHTIDERCPVCDMKAQVDRSSLFHSILYTCLECGNIFTLSPLDYKEFMKLPKGHQNYHLFYEHSNTIESRIKALEDKVKVLEERQIDWKSGP